MSKVKITDARDTVKLTPAGQLQAYSRYEYMIDELGPFSYEVPTDEDTPEKLQAEIDRKKKVLASIK